MAVVNRHRVLVGAAVVFVVLLFLGFLGWQRDRDIAAMNARYDRLAVAYQDVSTAAAGEGVEAPSLDEVTAPGPTPAVRVQGDQGPQGPRGQSGPQGDPGEPGPSGAPGGMGGPGPSGVDGADGVSGSPGPAGEDGTDGVDGAPGPQGPAGPQGEPGPAGAQGPMGPQGSIGPMPAGIVIPDGLGGYCTSTDPEGDGVYECPP